MKKYMIPILMLCLGYAGMMKAANTDISSLDNIIYVEPFNAVPGTQVQMLIKMKNSVPIRGFQFDLFLPEGVTAAKSAKGKILGSLTEDRLPDEDEHSLALTEQSDGSIRFLCGSQYDETFTGNDGQIATLTINIDGEMSNGEYPVFLKNMKLTETDISKFYETESIETTLTVGTTSYTILDENSTTAPTAATGVDVRVRRTITAGDWNTICLPFAMSEAQVKAAFGSDVQLGDFTGYEAEEDAAENVVGIKVNFNTVTAIEANHPYIIKVSSAISEFTVDGVDVDPEEEPTNAAVKRTKKAWSEMIGSYVPITLEDQMMFLSGSLFWYSAGLTQMKAYRAYFDFYDVLSAVEGSVKMFIHQAGDETGIEEVQMSNGSNDGEIYDLSGRRVEKAEKGIYIINNKKVLVK